CAAPIISDWWEGLDAFFAPDREILVVRRTEDVLAALDRDDRELRRIAEAARARALSEHTAERRAAELVKLLATLRRHPDLRRGGDRIRGAARAARAVRRDLSRRPVCRSGRGGAGRAARYDLASRGRVYAASRRPARLSDLPGGAAGTVRRGRQRPRRAGPGN